MKLELSSDALTTVNVPEHDYHSEILQIDNGEAFLSSSQVKAFIKAQSPKGETKAQELGTTAHKMIERSLKGLPFTVFPPLIKEDGKPVRAGSKAFEEGCQKIRDKYGEDGFAVLNNTDFEKYKRSVIGLKEVLEQYKAEGHMEGESSLFVGAKALENYKPQTDATMAMKKFFVANFPGYGIKVRPDVILYKNDGTIKLVDWKKTAKSNPGDIYYQKNSLMYDFSLHFYAMAVEAITGLPVLEHDLVFMSTESENGIYILRGRPVDNIKQFDFDSLSERIKIGKQVFTALNAQKWVVLPNNKGA